MGRHDYVESRSTLLLYGGTGGENRVELFERYGLDTTRDRKWSRIVGTLGARDEWSSKVVRRCMGVRALSRLPQMARVSQHCAPVY